MIDLGDADDVDETDLDTGVQMPAFAALLDELTRTLDGTLERGARLPFLSSGAAPEAPRLAITRWSGPGFRTARLAALTGVPGTFAMSFVAYPAIDSARPILSIQYLVSRERLQLVSLDLLDTDASDDSWSRDQLRRARRILELPVTAGHLPEQPGWARHALSSAAIVVGAPHKLPAAGLVRRAAMGVVADFLAATCPRVASGVGPVSAGRRRDAQNRFSTTMLAEDPGLACFKQACGPEVDALAVQVLYPLVG
jgi:hypothetical protein